MADEVKQVNFKRPSSIVERVVIHFAIAYFVWRWLWRNRQEKVTVTLKVNEGNSP
jgi:hypothetical protein